MPLYALPQNVALRVPATQPYSYAWARRTRHLVDPATRTIVADATD